MQNTFRRIAKISLFLVYLVILAGAVVRMTGSGMGCPDWPKCFGYYIPPTAEADLEWQPMKEYKTGQVIIVDEKLLVATDNFTTGNEFALANWEPYTTHDYAVFNAFHTWTEFLNRVLGALAGLATLVLALYSFKFWQKNKKLTIISWLVVFGMVFQAWLGATVVYSVLSPVKITLHMLMALVIVALLLYLVQISGKPRENFRFHKTTYLVMILAVALTLIQIIMGTQVRELIDEQIKLLGEGARAEWLNTDWIIFLVHRSFSILVLGVNVYLVYMILKMNLGFTKIYWVIVVIGLEIITGIAMAYLDFPFASQPLHLILATLLFGIQAYLLLEIREARRSLKTL